MDEVRFVWQTRLPKASSDPALGPLYSQNWSHVMRVVKQYPNHVWHKLYHALRGRRYIACSYCCIPISYHTFLPKEGNVFSKVAVFVSLLVPNLKFLSSWPLFRRVCQNCEMRLLTSSCLYICLFIYLSVCLFVSPSFRIERLSSHRKNFGEILDLSCFRKSV
jgi:hypothetical protein